MSETIFTPDLQNKTLKVERVFGAPKEKLWQAWSSAETFAKWWGPRGWQTTVKHFDFQPGGYLLYGMKCEDKNQGEFYGQESWGKAVYRAIDEPNEITYVDYFCDSEGNVDESMPKTTTTVKFVDEGGATRLVCDGVYESEAALKQVLEMGMEQGLKETWDRLEELVSAA